jgi:hypothetical protein
MSGRDQRLERVERALCAVYRREGEAVTSPSEGDVWRIMLRVRTAARTREDAAPGDLRFLWRFMSAGIAAAAVLLVVALSDVPPEQPPVSAADDTIVAVMNPTLPF